MRGRCSSSIGTAKTALLLQQLWPVFCRAVLVAVVMVMAGQACAAESPGGARRVVLHGADEGVGRGEGWNLERGQPTSDQAQMDGFLGAVTFDLLGL